MWACQEVASKRGENERGEDRPAGGVFPSVSTRGKGGGFSFYQVLPGGRLRGGGGHGDVVSTGRPPLPGLGGDG